MKQIKPCPFCGSDSKLRISGPVLSEERYVVCDNCDTYGPSGESIEDAIKLWNAAWRREDAEMSCKVTEFCPHCESEITMTWDTETYGYKAYCPVCGKRLMLCSACHDDTNGSCNYNTMSDTCRFNRSDSSWLNPFIPEASEALIYIRQEDSLYNRMQQIAEEAAELAQAVLKYNRAMGFGCYTPISPKDAIDAVIEEMADVLLCIEAAFPHCPGNMDFYNNLSRVYREKAERWAERLKEAKDE